MKSNLLTLILFVLLVSLAGCSKPDNNPQNASVSSNKIPVRLKELKISSSEMVIETSGQFTTDDETYLAFKTGGIIEKILVKEGDAVQTGQLLAQLNPTEIESQVGQAQLALDKAKRDFRRAENLFRDSVATLEQFQNTRTAMELAERQLTAAQFNRSYSEIRAVRNGFILKKLANEGQVIAPGNPVLLTNGATQNQWLLRAGVSDREWGKIQVGDPASITCDAVTNKTFQSRVSHKSAGIDPVSGTFTVDLKIVNPGSLASGLFGSAVIRTTRQQPSWQIPYEALLDGNAKTGYVFVTEDKQTAKKVQVRIGELGKDFVAITDGLDGFRYLVISGNAYLKDGSAISVE